LFKVIASEETPSGPVMRISPPSGFVVSRRESDQAELRWSPAPRADYYLIEYKPTFNSRESPKVCYVMNVLKGKSLYINPMVYLFLEIDI